MERIAFCGGGSAGHVMPNIAVISELNKKHEIIYIGTDGIEKEICKKYGVTFREFSAVKLVRGKILCNLSIPVRLFKSVNECRKILKEYNPSLLFCKGGYASLPPALAAFKLKIPVLTHESDRSAGLANKIIAIKAERILTSFEDTAAKFKNGVYTGAPLRRELFGQSKISAKENFGFNMRPAVLVFGGGSGSKNINDNLCKIIEKLCKKYNVLHICGKNCNSNTNIYGYKKLEFCNDMGSAYAAADYAVARCGSNSAFELIAHKIPTLFIPLENGATRGDQAENAEYFQSRGLCRVLKESDLTPDRLLSEIENLINDEKLKTALKFSTVKCGNNNIIAEINSFLKS